MPPKNGKGKKITARVMMSSDDDSQTTCSGYESEASETDNQEFDLETSHWLAIMMDTYGIKRYKIDLLLSYTFYTLINVLKFSPDMIDRHAHEPDTVFSTIVMTVFRLFYKFVDDDHIMFDSFCPFVKYRIGVQKWFELESTLFKLLDWNLFKIIENFEQSPDRKKYENMSWSPPMTSKKWAARTKKIVHSEAQQKLVQRVYNVIQDI
jgi:hypothetical protein